jgi:hypothetical protein
MKPFHRSILTAVGILMIVGLHPAKAQQLLKKTYYVDSENGNDLNSGLGVNAAWKSLNKVNEQVFEPGQVILLKCGSVWEGQLLLKGSGSASNPIQLSSYGNGNKPIVNGNGKVDQVILLADIDGWHINNLELTNKSTTVGNRTGILVSALKNETKTYFHFTNLFIHDIMGDYSFEAKGKNTGGIGIIGGPDTKFDNILIENCEIGPVNRVGIFTNLTKGDKATRGNRPFTNLIIRKNKIHHCAGDGAIIRYAYKPLIAYNLAYENHNAPENLVKHGVALWCRSTDEAIFEYNEVHHTRGLLDGQAFDADLDSYRTLVQYNYSHDNEGGFMLVYGSSSESIVRYNLSVNDGKKGKHIFDFPVWTSPRGSGIFHNNSIILPNESGAVIADEALETARFYNNIFYTDGNSELVVKSDGKSAFFKNNGYYGYSKREITDQAAVLNYELTKALPEAAPILKKTKVYSKFKTNGKKAVGISIIEADRGYWLPDLGKNDFLGNPLKVKQPAVGAFQY